MFILQLWWFVSSTKNGMNGSKYDQNKFFFGQIYGNTHSFNQNGAKMYHSMHNISRTIRDIEMELKRNV